VDTVEESNSDQYNANDNDDYETDDDDEDPFYPEVSAYLY
jgi:hypothetical protein